MSYLFADREVVTAMMARAHKRPPLSRAPVLDREEASTGTNDEYFDMTEAT
jgi:hypothetical protein